MTDATAANDTSDALDTPTLLDGDAAPADGAPAADAPKPNDTDTPADDADKPKDGEGDKAGDEDKPAAKAPEKYEIALEEGQTLDAEALEVIDPVLRELDLDNDQANKLAKAWPGLQAKMAERFAAKAAEDQTAELTRYADEWKKQATADAEIGGTPEVMGPKLATIAKARDQFASPELRQLLSTTRLGNHPEVLRLFFKVGQAIGEGSFVRGDAAADERKSTAEIMYPHMAPAKGG